MAFTSGTATNYLDYWNKLLDFLQNDAALIAANQEWTVAWSAPVGAPNSTDIVLKGPGLSASDEIFIGLRLTADIPGDRFAIHMCGMSGVLTGATEFDGHVNCTPKNVRMFLGNAPMGYWFSASGRRFVAVAKVSTVYETMYGGLILPFATPVNYPYPLFIGGCAGEGTSAIDWRATSADHTAFHKPRSTSAIETSAWLLSPDGTWKRCGDSGSQAAYTNLWMGPDAFGDDTIIQLTPTWTGVSYGYRDVKDRMAACYGGNFALSPIMFLQDSPNDQTYGLLDGVFHVPGRGNSAENIVNMGGVDYLVVQNTFRTSLGDYCAIKLES